MSFGDQGAETESHAGLEDRILTLLSVLTALPATGYSVINLGRRDTGHRLLHLGAMNGCERLVGTLVAHPEIEIDALDMNGYSALHYACWRGEIGSAKLLIRHGADVMLRSVHGVGCVDLARMHGQPKATEIILVLRTSNSWVDAGALEVDGYESAREAEDESELEQELEALDTLEDEEDSGVWLEHFATESDVLEEEEEEETEDSFDVSSLVGSEIEDLPWIDRGEWIGEEMSDDSSQWSGSDAGQHFDEKDQSSPCERPEIVQAPSSPSLGPLVTPQAQNSKDARANEVPTTWIKKTFEFEFLKSLNHILPEKAFRMSSIQAFNISTYMAYNFS
ncbi:hypothetical protein BGZ65_012401, partial [Modicella reniformis]